MGTLVRRRRRRRRRNTGLQFCTLQTVFSATLKSSTTLLTSSRQWLTAKHTVRTRLIAVHAAHAIRRQTIARTPSAPQASLNNTPGAVWNPPHIHTHNKSHEIAIDPPVRKSIHYLIIHRVKLRHRVRVPNAKYARIMHTTRDRCDKTHTHTRTHSEQARAGPSSVSIQCRSHSERHMREPLQTHCLTTLTRGTSMPAQPAQVEHRAVHEPFALKQPWATIGAHRSPFTAAAWVKGCARARARSLTRIATYNNFKIIIYVN